MPVFMQNYNSMKIILYCICPSGSIMRNARAERKILSFLAACENACGKKGLNLLRKTSYCVLKHIIL